MGRIREVVSIIMPAYNAEKTLPQAVESVMAQTYPHWELIIIDDASRDGTRELIRAYAQQEPRIRVLENEKNCGVSETRRRGLEASRGQWIALLDSYDAWKPEKLQKQMALAVEKGSQLVYTGSAYMDQDGNGLDWVFHIPESVTYRKLMKQNVISNSSALIRKECYERNLVMGDDFHEDFSCWMQFLRNGGIAHGIDEPLLIYRLSSGSKSGNKFRSIKMAWKSYRVIGVGLVETAYYWSWYCFTGVLKHRHLRIGKGKKT